MHTVFFVLVVMAETQSDLHKTLSRKGKAVHRTPTNDYQKFVNVFVFVSSGKRGDAVLKAQRMWKSYTEAERAKQLDLLTEKATKALDRECTGLISSFFSRAPSNIQVCTYCVLSLNDKRVRESDEYPLVFKLQTAADGRLWHDGNYDLMVSACYAPGLSRYNPIEHLWSPCSKWLAGVSLPACLPGECSAPALQSLAAEELARKEKQVFSNALDALDGFCLCSANATKATNVMKFPTSDKWLLPPITPCPEKPDQYQTFRQQATALSFSKPDQHMKGVFNESCPKCRYVFTSESDQVKHIKLVHGGTQAIASVVDEVENPRAKQKKSTVSQCPVCNETFNGRYQLRKHQDAAGHKLGRGRPSRATSKAPHLADNIL